LGCRDETETKLWGFVDPANIYGDASARKILGYWWSGEGPRPSTWRFNLKARPGDPAGRSFPVHLPNDAGRDRILRKMATDADQGKPTKVFLTGRLCAFEAPTNFATSVGLYMELDSTADVRFALPDEGGP
jgi:hypothetical protein